MPEKVSLHPEKTCMMSSETAGQTVTMRTGEAAAAAGSVAVKGEGKVRVNKWLLQEATSLYGGLLVRYNT